MREFLEDAHQHRDDGYGRAQAHVRRELPKRFYKDATVRPAEGGFAVALDGRVPRTPGMKHVIVPSEAIASAMAAEWAAQGEFIDPQTMPLVRLVNSAVEAGEESIPALRAECSIIMATICCSIVPTARRSWWRGRRRHGTRHW